MLPLDHDRAVRWILGERAMKMSDAGFAFLIGWEGARSRPYDDGGPGLGNCTVGVGHLIHYGPCTQAELDQPALSLVEIMRLLRSDVAKFEAAVNALSMPLNQNQFDALVSFTFNAGAGALQSFDGDITFIRAFVHDGAGNTLDALVRRREAEIQLYETPVPGEDDDMKPFLVWATDTSKLYLVGPWGASWITNADDVGTLEGLYGKASVVLHESSLRSLGTRIVVGA